MRRLKMLPIAMLITLAGCGLIASDSNPDEPKSTNPSRDLAGVWNIIFHHEVGENIHIPAKLNIQQMECNEFICNLTGFVESDELGALKRLALKYAYYYPQLDLMRLSYSYKTIDTFSRTVVLSITDFPSINSARLAMAGDFIIYGTETPASFFNAQDEEVLAATRKGKAVHAGQVTAWLSD